jgi:hypothetical protein
LTTMTQLGPFSSVSVWFSWLLSVFCFNYIFESVECFVFIKDLKISW